MGDDGEHVGHSIDVIASEVQRVPDRLRIRAR
jgi:hypothetical protein